MAQILTHTRRVLNEIAAERERQQVELAYSVGHDDGHHPYEWIALLTRYAGRAVEAGGELEADTYRRRLVQVAAVAVAAIESLDRARAQ